jgi:hypothetical protein
MTKQEKIYNLKDITHLTRLMVILTENDRSEAYNKLLDNVTTILNDLKRENVQ